MLKLIDHNRYVAGMLAIGLLMCLGFVSCQPTVPSIITPGKVVTSDQLAREVQSVQSDYDAKLAAAELAKAELARKVAQRARLVEIASGVAQIAATGGLNPVSGAAAAVQVLTLLGLGGAVLDNRRKDKVIKAKKEIAKS